MMSDFFVRVLALRPSALAIASSWSLSFDSRTDCSSASAATSCLFLGWDVVVLRRAVVADGGRRRMTGADAPRNLESHPCSTFGGTWNGVLPGGPGRAHDTDREGTPQTSVRASRHARVAGTN